MIALKNMFERLLENKVAVVADYYEVKLMEDKKRRDEDDSYYRRIDQSTPPFVYSDNESATILGTVDKEIQSMRELSCPTCLVSYHGYLIFKCEKCEQPFCERCKWSVQGVFFISCALPNDPWSKVLVQYKNPFQELISIGCASLRTYTPYHMCD